MHPAARILLYVLSALAVPGLNFFWTLGLLVVSLLFAAFHPRAAWGVLRRARWLFLLMALGYAYVMPGAALIPTLGSYSPSLPGAMAGAAQVARLALLLLLLDILVLCQEESRLLAGLYSIFKALRPLGVPAERMTVRLALTLQALHAPAGQRVSLSEVLKVGNRALAGPSHLAVAYVPWRTMDSVLLLVGAILWGAAWRFA